MICNILIFSFLGPIEQRGFVRASLDIPIARRSERKGTMQWSTLPSECRQRKVPSLVVGCRNLSYLRFLALDLRPIRSKLSHKFMLVQITSGWRVDSSHPRQAYGDPRLRTIAYRISPRDVCHRIVPEDQRCRGKGPEVGLRIGYGGSPDHHPPYTTLPRKPRPACMQEESHGQ